MSLKNVVPFPHRSGHCRKCSAYFKHGTLCPKCEEFANQDRVRQNGGIIPQETVLMLTDQTSVQEYLLPAAENEAESCTDEEFERYLKSTSLSPQQRRIVFLLTIKGRTQREIARILGTSPGNVSNQIQRIGLKLGTCRAPAIYRRGKSVERPSDELSLDPGIKESTEDEPAVPNHRLLRRVCPRCRDRVRLACKDFQYCMNCSWTSDEYV